MAGAAGGPRRDNKQHYSFDDTRLEDIGRENVALLHRLARVATRPSELGKPPAVVKLAESSAQRNRRKAAAEIERGNLVRGRRRAVVGLRRLAAAQIAGRSPGN